LFVNIFVCYKNRNDGIRNSGIHKDVMRYDVIRNNVRA
jgi:hypothetical protein